MKTAIVIGIIVCAITYLLSSLSLNWAVKQGFMVTAELRECMQKHQTNHLN